MKDPKRKFEFIDKLEILKAFKIKEYKAGDRLNRHQEAIQQFNVVLKGKIGILYPDLQKMKFFSAGRMQQLTEADVKKKMSKNKKNAFIT